MLDPASDRHTEVRAAMAGWSPAYRVGSIARIGSGLDHAAYEVNGELVIRFSTAADPAGRAADVEREARLLTTVAALSPLPVPEPLFTAPAQGCLAYRKLAGTPLIELPAARRAAHAGPIGATLGDFLAALHAVPSETVTGLVGVDDQQLDEWLVEAAWLHAVVAGSLPDAHRGAIAAFFDAEPPAGEWSPVFSHNDLGIEHVLVNPANWTVTGIIDWSDAAVVDPGYDFGLIYRDLGPAALDAALGNYRLGDGANPGLVERARFYARCRVFEDLAYGLETNRRGYVEKSLAALVWLFPPTD